MAAIFHVRTSVVENHMTEEELVPLGITRESLATAIEDGSAAIWCVEVAGEIAGFSLAFKNSREVNALFVLPQHERKGHGARLLDAAVQWLEDFGSQPITLATDNQTRAYRFYLRRGWRDTGRRSGPDGDVVLEYVGASGQ